MRSNTTSEEQSYLDASDGVVRTVTQARAGARRGMIKVLAISTALAVLAVGAVFLITSYAVQQPAARSPLQTAQANTLATRTWDLRHLGANGQEKCRAFRLVIRHAAALQVDGGGTISQGDQKRLQTELNTAKAMSPLSLTPVQCGVPL